MINEAIQHCPGIGSSRLAHLHAEGFRTWADVLEHPGQFSTSWRSELLAECGRCQAALETGNLGYFIERFVPQDRWRILHHFFEQATFFDIETEGLEHDAPITTIVCWHQGRLRIFVEHENLDDFLTLLDEVSLLVSFNGSTFDVPRVLDAFHIPALGCGHIDLRWSCYHRGYVGGLKAIAAQMDIHRPADLQSADGQLAVQLWHTWRGDQDQNARKQLIRYCAADVLLLVALAEQLVGRTEVLSEQLWRQLPTAPPTTRRFDEAARQVEGVLFGDCNSSHPRGRHLRAIRSRLLRRIEKQNKPEARRIGGW